uniref:Probable oligoribonuclease n=1 Tax=Parastrongyloides trichosuri TaxID=131310 RepID=A0A0N4ZIA1_PARTI
MSSQKEGNIVWIDLELTGLDVNKDSIIEICVVITDSDLNIVDKGLSYTIKHDDEVYDNMNDWCKETFAKNGLLNDLKSAVLTTSEVENIVLEYIKKYCDYKKSPIAGNTVYMDRMFIMKHMPKIDEFLHYRIIDVSSVKELVFRWYKKTYKKSVCGHRARSDIFESIEELKWYKKNFFI